MSDLNHPLSYTNPLLSQQPESPSQQPVTLPATWITRSAIQITLPEIRITQPATSHPARNPNHSASNPNHPASNPRHPRILLTSGVVLPISVSGESGRAYVPFSRTISPCAIGITSDSIAPGNSTQWARHSTTASESSITPVWVSGGQVDAKPRDNFNSGRPSRLVWSRLASRRFHHTISDYGVHFFVCHQIYVWDWNQISVRYLLVWSTV